MWMRIAAVALAIAASLQATTPALAADEAPAAPAKRLPIEDFVRASQFASPALSPDGKHLVVTTRLKDATRDVPVMLVYRLADMKQIAAVRLKIYEVPAAYTWVTNDRILVGIAKEFGSLDQPQFTGEILGMDLDGGKQEYLFGYQMSERLKRGSPMPNDYATGYVVGIPGALDGTFYLLEQQWRGERSALYRIDSRTGVRHIVSSIGLAGATFIQQNDGKPRFAYGANLNARAVLYRFDDAKNDWVLTHDADKSPDFEPIGFTPDDRDFYAVVVSAMKSDATTTSRLIKESLANGKSTPLAQVGSGLIDMVQYGSKSREPLAVATSVDRPVAQYLDPANPEAELHKQLSAQFADSYVDFISHTADGSKLLFSVKSDRDSGAYYLLDRSTMKAQMLFTAKSWMDPARMGERRPIHFKASDGVELHGYLTLPAGYKSGALPLVLYPHGGPHGSSDHWFFDTDSQFLASRGYAVLQVNYRGSEGRGQEFEAMGYRHWADRIQDDLIDGVRWAVGEKVVDPERVCVYGGSFGGYSAMMSVVRAPTMFKCAVGYAGLYDIGKWAAKDGFAGDRRSASYIERFTGNAQEQARISPSQVADKINVPVLIVHGAEDDVTPKDQAETMHAALLKANKPHDYVMVPNEGHGFYAEKNRLAFYQRLETFLDKYIGNGAATAKPADKP